MLHVHSQEQRQPNVLVLVGLLLNIPLAFSALTQIKAQPKK